MDVHQLRVFCSVYRNRSFSKASRELFLSQPTISDHIKTLEEALGSRLFDRLGRSIAPTKESLMLYPRAIEIIEKLDTITSDIKLVRAEPSGELLVGASSLPGSLLIPRAAASFKLLYPAVSFRLVARDSGAITNMVMDHELPLGIVGAIMERPAMERRALEFSCLTDDDLILVCADRMRHAEKGTISLGDLPGLPFVARHDGSGTKKTVEEYFTNKGVPADRLNVVASFSSADSMAEAIRSGLGAGVLPRLYAAREIETGSLREIKMAGLKMRQNFYIVTHRKRTISGVLRLFLDHLKTVASGLKDACLKK